MTPSARPNKAQNMNINLAEVDIVPLTDGRPEDWQGCAEAFALDDWRSSRERELGWFGRRSSLPIPPVEEVFSQEAMGFNMENSKVSVMLRATGFLGMRRLFPRTNGSAFFTQDL